MTLQNWPKRLSGSFGLDLSSQRLESPLNATSARTTPPAITGDSVSMKSAGVMTITSEPTASSNDPVM